jgi:prepilin-type N-terminal cleavage/methylation domain-containing protein
MGIRYMNKKGITLLELIIVMVIIAIGAALMVPGFGAWMPHYRLRGATRDIASTLRAAQVKAVSNNFRYGVAFDTANQQFQLYRNSGGIGDFQVDGSPNDLPSGVTFFNIAGLPTDGPGGLPFVRFYPDSTASAANGTITLVNNKNTQKLVRISGSTGRVTIQ